MAHGKELNGQLEIFLALSESVLNTAHFTSITALQLQCTEKPKKHPAISKTTLSFLEKGHVPQTQKS